MPENRVIQVQTTPDGKIYVLYDDGSLYCGYELIGMEHERGKVDWKKIILPLDGRSNA